MDLVVPVSGPAAAAALDSMKAAWGATDEMFLFTNDLRPDPSTPPAAFTEPVGTWYSGQAKVVAYGQTFRMADGKMAFRTNQIQFNWDAAGGAQPVMVYGAGVMSADGLTVRGAGRFATPLMLEDVLSSLAVSVVFPQS